MPDASSIQPESVRQMQRRIKDWYSEDGIIVAGATRISVLAGGGSLPPRRADSLIKKICRDSLKGDRHADARFARLSLCAGYPIMELV
jgi:hypothetical protein